MENVFDHKFEWLRQQVDELQRRATQAPAQQQMPQDAYEELLTSTGRELPDEPTL